MRAGIALGGGQTNPRGGRSRPELPRRLSSQRPVRLRALADRIERQAQRTSNPSVARALARRMRVRASELEAGEVFSDETEAARQMAESTVGDELIAAEQYAAARLARHRRLTKS